MIADIAIRATISCANQSVPRQASRSAMAARTAGPSWWSIARVRVTVHTDGATVIREGHGTGEGRGTSPGEVHDIALKAAETASASAWLSLGRSLIACHSIRYFLPFATRRRFYFNVRRTWILVLASRHESNRKAIGSIRKNRPKLIREPTGKSKFTTAVMSAASTKSMTNQKFFWGPAQQLH